MAVGYSSNTFKNIFVYLLAASIQRTDLPLAFPSWAWAVNACAGRTVRYFFNIFLRGSGYPLNKIKAKNHKRDLPLSFPSCACSVSSEAVMAEGCVCKICESALG